VRTPRGGEFECEWQPIESVADRGDCDSIRVVQGERPIDCLSTIDEESNRWRPRDLLRCWRVLGIGTSQWKHRKIPFA
jgi:hypothetical protein